MSAVLGPRMVLYELGLEQYPLLSILCRMWHTAGTECDWMNASPRPTPRRPQPKSLRNREE